ncbi:MAG: FAD binding domain-containing protein, partial [Caulobacterales bacterium]|nr:FAD binding domain-containing protein [Caulobacterales bacterium]
MYNFAFHNPASLDEAKQRLRSSADPKILGGGQTLIPTMKRRLAMPSDVVAVAALAELQGVRVDGDTLTIGAGVKHAEVNASDEVRRAIPALAYLAGLIGDPLVRNMGTLGGSIANNDPSADYPSAVLGLGATVHTDARAIPADSFFTGMFETALDEREIVLRVSFPLPRRAGYAKFPNPASRYATVGVFVADTGSG